MMQLTWLALLVFFSFPIQSNQGAVVLEPGSIIKHDIGEHDAPSYPIALPANQYLLITVKQLKIDLVVTLFDPEGKVVVQSDITNGIAEPERISTVIQTAGTYRLEIRPAKGSNNQGAYELHVEELHPASDRDVTIVKAERLFDLAEQLRTKGDASSLRQAIQHYLEYTGFAHELGDLEAEATAYQRISVAYRLLGDAAKALETLNQALALVRQTPNRMMEAGILNSLGNLYAFQGDAPKSVDFYNGAILLLHQLGAKLQESSLLHNLGGVYLQFGEFEKSLDSLNQALEIRRAAGDVKGEANTVNALAQAYAWSSDWAKTSEYLQQALNLARRVQDRRLEAAVLNNTSVVNKETGDYQQALQNCEQALAIYATVADRRLEVIALNNLGLIYLQLNERQKALEAFEKARNLAVTSQELLGEAKALTNIGLIYSESGKPDEALTVLRQALAIQQNVKSRADEAFTLKGIAEIERRNGNLNAAREAITSAIDIIESLRNRISNQELQTAFFSSKRDFYELLTDTLMQMHAAEPAKKLNIEALQISELSKARGLLDMLSEARIQITQGIDAALLEQRNSIQKQLNAKEQYRIRLLSGKPAPAQVEAVEKEIGQLLSQLQEVRARIRTANPRYALMTQPQPVTLAEIQQQVLDKETVLLEYALGKEQSYLWAVTQNAVYSYRLASRADIEAKAKRVYELLTMRNRRQAGESVEEKLLRVKKADSDFHQEAEALSRLILTPAASLLGKKRLLIVSEGWLQYIPFAVLPKPESNSPLIVENAVVNLPSTAVLTALRQELRTAAAAPKTLAIFADPVFSENDPRVKELAAKNAKRNMVQTASLMRSSNDAGLADFYRLPASRQEAEALAKTIPLDERLTALDFAANKQTATAQNLRDYRIIHFATHALLNGKTPELSGIVLSLIDETGKPLDGFLRLHEIYNLNLNAELVVLSGCKTALGKDVKGEGLIGLTRGFMYAGARRVVASLWSVEDQATSELMGQFYKAILTNKMTPAAALRAAQVEMIKANKAPYYWAAFTMQGEWK